MTFMEWGKTRVFLKGQDSNSQRRTVMTLRVPFRKHNQASTLFVISLTNLSEKIWLVIIDWSGLSDGFDLYAA